MEGSGTGTVVADAISPVILLGAGLPEVAQPFPGGVGGHQPHVTAAVLPSRETPGPPPEAAV